MNTFIRIASILTIICFSSLFSFAQEDLLPPPDMIFDSESTEGTTPTDSEETDTVLPDIEETQTTTESVSETQSQEVQENNPLEAPALPPIDETDEVEEVVETAPEETQEAAPSEAESLPPIETTEVEEVSVKNSYEDEPETPAQETPTQTYQESTSYPVEAQSEHNGWAITLHGGSNLFYGDVRIYEFWPAKEYNNERKWAAGVSLDKEFNQYFHLRGNVLYGTLSGTKREYSSGVPANLYFDASLFEYSAVAKLVLGAENPLSFYTYAGLGFVHFRTEQKDLRTNEVYASYGYDGDTKTSPTIETVAPIGFGFNYRFTENLSANIDISLRIVNSDKLDATISGGEGLLQDMYGYSALGISYTFGRKSVTVVPNMTEAPVQEVVEEDITEEIAEEETTEIEMEEVVVEETNTEEAEVLPEITEITISEEIDTLPVAETPIVEEQSLPVVEEGTPIVEEQTLPIEDEEISPIVEEAIEESENVPIVEESEALKQQSSIQNVSTEIGLVYRVQILAIQKDPKNEIAKLQSKYGLNETIYEEKTGVWTKYTVGAFKTVGEASNYRKTLVNKGIADCFVVPYYQGKRITLQEARQIK
jgi:opacity protein-like surface antigen